MDSSDLVIVVGSIAAMLAGFFATMRYILNQGATDRLDATNERKALTLAITKMAASTEKVAVATTKGNNEAKERNGHLGEQNVKLATMVAVQTTQLTGINATLTSSAILLVKDTKTAFEGTQAVAELLKTSVETLASNTETAHQGTENVRKTLKKNRATGPFTIQGNLT